MKHLYRFSASELRDHFLSGNITAVAISEYFLQRIKNHDDKLNSFLTVFKNRVLKKAEELDKKRLNNYQMGKLAGVPIAIKDNMHLVEEITTCGSSFLKNYKAPFSATVVELLEREDALLIGKTNLDEFAMGSSTEKSAFFPTKNPWNLECVPGGSSGGSTAAVAARFSLIATGSDTGGSIRQPAAFCGVVGFKPTYGRVSRNGLVAFGSSLDQIGPIGATVSDCALAMETIGHPCHKDATCFDLPPETYRFSQNFKDVRIGIPKNFLNNLKPDVEKNYLNAIDVMKSLGAEPVEIDLDILKYSIAVYKILATAEASTNLARFDGVLHGTRSSVAETLDQVYNLSRKEGFGREVKQRIMLGTYVLSADCLNSYYKKAQQVRSLIIDAFEHAYSVCDAVIMPVTPSGAFQLGATLDPMWMYLQDVFTIPANLAGLPAISVPSGYDDQNLPLGIQIIGPQLCDVLVMQYAYAYEQATLWAQVPPLFSVGENS